MISSFRRQLLHFRDQVDAMLESILVCSDEDLDRPLELKFEGRPFRTNLRSAIRYTIEEYRVHEGQIAGNQFLIETLRATSSEGEVAAFSPYDRSEAAWLAAELYVAAACLISRLVGYPDQWVDEHPKEDEWSIKEIVEHLIHMERSGEWSLGQLAVKAREARHDFNSSPL
jgi:hypothetical protein